MAPDLFVACGYTDVATRGYYCISARFYDDMECVSLRDIGLMRPKDTADLYDWLNSRGYVHEDTSGYTIVRMLDMARHARRNIPIVWPHTVSVLQRATMLKLINKIEHILQAMNPEFMLQATKPKEPDDNAETGYLTMSVDELLFGRGGCA